MRRLADHPSAWERDCAYFLWTLFASAVVLLGLLKLAG